MELGGVFNVLVFLRNQWYKAAFHLAEIHDKGEAAMNEAEQYLVDQIKCCVWSGYFSRSDVQEMICDVLDDDVDEAKIRACADKEFERKMTDQAFWPDRTDCDRLDDAFAVLTDQGVLALQNAGYTMSDGHEEADAILSELPEDIFFGYCFFHGQDVERAVRGEGLYIAFDHVQGDVPEKAKVGELLKATLEKFGFSVAWDGNVDSRILVSNLDWKRRQEL